MVFGSPMVQETFTFYDTDGTIKHFSIPKLLRMIEQNPAEWELANLPIGSMDAELMRRDRGVEETRIKSYPMNKIDVPGIACQFPEGSLLIVDGSHRLVKRVALNLPTMRFYVAPESVWKHGLVDGRDLFDLKSGKRMIS